MLFGSLWLTMALCMWCVASLWLFTHMIAVSRLLYHCPSLYIHNVLLLYLISSSALPFEIVKRWFSMSAHFGWSGCLFGEQEKSGFIYIFFGSNWLWVWASNKLVFVFFISDYFTYFPTFHENIFNIQYRHWQFGCSHVSTSTYLFLPDKTWKTIHRKLNTNSRKKELQQEILKHTVHKKLSVVVFQPFCRFIQVWGAFYSFQ